MDPEIEKEWAQWVKEKHIPAIMKTGLFKDHKFYRLLDHEDQEGVTYVIQHFASSIDDYKNYLKKFSDSIEKKFFEQWRDRFVAFHTVMEIVN